MPQQQTKPAKSEQLTDEDHAKREPSKRNNLHVSRGRRVDYERNEQVPHVFTRGASVRHRKTEQRTNTNLLQQRTEARVKNGAIH